MGVKRGIRLESPISNSTLLSDRVYQHAFRLICKSTLGVTYGKYAHRSVALDKTKIALISTVTTLHQPSFCLRMDKKSYLDNFAKRNEQHSPHSRRAMGICHFDRNEVEWRNLNGIKGLDLSTTLEVTYSRCNFRLERVTLSVA